MIEEINSCLKTLTLLALFNFFHFNVGNFPLQDALLSYPPKVGIVLIYRWQFFVCEADLEVLIMFVCY